MDGSCLTSHVRLGQQVSRFDPRGTPHASCGFVIANLRFAFRQLAKSKAFAVITVLTLAIGIGANTAIFSIVNAVLLEPLPYPHSERLVQVCEMPAPGNYISTIAASLGAGFLISNQLYGVSSLDPVVMAGVVLVLTAVAVLASWLPARRASRVNPSVALRSE
jgi:hypothetical protein